ncbi:MAG: methyltransferase domain-containing protein [Halodesulfurarchaeum sp.]
MPVDREAIRENAKYLRNVRPIDPDEITEYVPQNPDPRAIRQVLRESAWDLDIVERKDGTFVPVSDDSLTMVHRPVERLPPKYADVLEDLLVEEWGPNWFRGTSGDTIRKGIRRMKEDYLHQNSVEYDREGALAYAIYHLADYYATGWYVVQELGIEGLLDSRLSILDVGAGVGGPMLGIHDRVFDTSESRDVPPLVKYTAVEPSEASTLLDALGRQTNDNFHLEIVDSRAESFEPDDTYDLVVFFNVLSELEDPVAVANEYLQYLEADGTMVLLSPADRNTSLLLRDVERSLESQAGATVYGPTVRLWDDDRPTDECWSFVTRPDLETPAFQERLGGETADPEEIRNVDVQYSYSFLRRDDTSRYDVSLSTDAVAKMGEMDRHVSNRIVVIGVKLSNDLGSDDHAVFKISDGSESLAHFAVLVNETGLNRELIDAEYGDLLRFDGVLALYNEDESAYNLVVDEETIVDSVGGLA